MVVASEVRWSWTLEKTGCNESITPNQAIGETVKTCK
jgi:hypothetical protein